MSLKTGFVGIIGRPNAGKSTLLNAILGEKVSIISSKPNTTRTQIRGIYNSKDAQIIFIDTPGIHNAKDNINKLMVEKAFETIKMVDIVYFLVEPGEKKGPEYKQILELIKNEPIKKFLIITKIDAFEKKIIYDTAKQVFNDYQFDQVIPISSIKKINIDKLIEITKELLPEGDPIYPQDEIVDISEKFLIAEFIREQIFEILQDEVPYDTFVECELIEDKSENLMYVSAAIYTKRESQKAIILGKRGSTIKKIGQKARIELEKFFGVKIFLDLFVKVKEDWQSRDEFLKLQGLL
ncbi:GTPase Era [Calditerrivibrio nitroreducens]|uniref:GTPase Era n=1 Tax=Calditerrivibrio nitroreducens (strain DSM 19672 / NBRC 101217 / Yu37-1) TaxID=768670 RepID=E4THP8_CALNY|nr:GTPase Era [Calditerrivibrio nitroreducens]ADR18873.1 GTP-binding protein Era [Calditerrivibrio nitroreducens DSM 19672]